MIKQYVLGYVTDGDGIMLLERTVPGHPQFGFWNGVGGSIEPGETYTQAMERELWEEARLTGSCLYRGSVMFSNGHMVHMFRITNPKGVANRHCSEGTLHWINQRDALDVPLYSGQEVWLPMILSDIRPFAVHAMWDAENNRLVEYEEMT